MTKGFVGVGGVRKHACAAVADHTGVLGVCEQERVTRVRGAGCNSTGLPDEALDVLLTAAGMNRTDVSSCAVAEEIEIRSSWQIQRINHHEAHASAAYFTSGFESAVVVICDREPPGFSVWAGNGSTLTPLDWRWSGISLADLYTELARLMGFDSGAGDQRFEVMARMMAAKPATGLPRLFTTDGGRICAKPEWQTQIASLATSDIAAKAAAAAGLQGQLSDVLLDLLRGVRKTSASHLCLGGSLFFHSAINSAVRESALFEQVHVPANPGNAGLAVGAAMSLSKAPPSRLSAFMGPAFDPDEIKWTLDNCKLRYDWVEDGEAIESAVEHLQHGRLVGWFEGRMEWGPRALGARSILANPFSPYVLQNLNQFLKRRDAWRGYALSIDGAAVRTHFTGPAEARFMECDYRPHDVAQFRHVMPSEFAGIRVHTVGDDAPPRFRALLRHFGQRTGTPCLANTSFNGFHEPIVCTPRDAVRVFFGSGLDVLFLDRFVLTK